MAEAAVESEVLAALRGLHEIMDKRHDELLARMDHIELRLDQVKVAAASAPTTPLKSPKFAAQTFLTWNNGSVHRVANLQKFD